MTVIRALLTFFSFYDLLDMLVDRCFEVSVVTVQSEQDSHLWQT